MSHRVYFDHDSGYKGLINELGRRGHDCISSTNAGLDRARDEEQLAFAAVERRVLVTANQPDFARLHWEWMSAGRHHSGIVVAPQLMDFKQRISKLRHLLTSALPDELADTLIYLNSWDPARQP